AETRCGGPERADLQDVSTLATHAVSSSSTVAFYSRNGMPRRAHSVLRRAEPRSFDGKDGPAPRPCRRRGAESLVPALALLAGPHQLPHFARRERKFVAAHAVLRERVLDRARERTRSAHPSAFAAALDAVLGERRRRLHVPHANRGRHLGERRDPVFAYRPEPA